MNYILPALVFIVPTLALLVFVLVRNWKDEKDFERHLNDEGQKRHKPTMDEEHI